MKRSALFSAIALAAVTGNASAFVTINDGDSFVAGALSGDQLLGSGLGPDVGYVIGGDADTGVPANGQFGEAPEVYNFTRTTTGFTMPAGYTMIDENEYEIEFPEDGELEEIGILTDQVWRNDGDSTLVFATRITLLPEFDDVDGVFEYEGEFNDIVRDYGSFTTAIGFFAASAIDRSYDAVEKSGGTVTFINDISGEEDNPYSVWHLVATNATSYTQSLGALTLVSEADADEGRPTEYIFGGDQLSFTPVPVPAALPLLVSALGGLGFVARRRG